MGKALPIEEKNFVNSMDQVIKPGDDIVAVTSHWRGVNITKAKYLGYRERPSYYKSDVKDKFVCVEHQLTRNALVHKDTGVEFDRKAFNKTHPYPVRNYSARWNSPEWDEEEKRFTKFYAERNAAEKEAQKDYIQVKLPYGRKSQLQLNRIFPIVTTIAELAESKVNL